ncbi:MAG TPA: serine/threonine-protein kinase, partial [Coriobacteriia bacterium]|nr:serine/threonine-protein kinase [Coriobacteriia bacterium]
MEQPLILNRYRALEVLGEGGHGPVVLAYDSRMQRRVAIKRLTLGSRGSRGAGALAGLAEARTAALLNHPNIVTVHEWDTDADEAFIIMEYVDGATLADLMSVADGPLTLDETAAVVEAVAEALEYAHDNGVLHLDLKPENVFVMRDGRVKVGDFGIAALSSATGGARGAGGTPGYMPPEQVGGEELDERADVWAFGLLVYEMLTAANPFYAETWEGAAFKARIVDAPAPSEFEAGLPPTLDDTLLAALSRVPAERYAGVRSLSNHLLDDLGDPAEGRHSLARLVALWCEEAPCEADRAGNVGLWDRLARWAPYATGALSAVVAAWLAWAGL